MLNRINFIDKFVTDAPQKEIKINMSNIIVNFGSNANNFPGLIRYINEENDGAHANGERNIEITIVKNFPVAKGH